ncbi:hypothetical protein, partial [Streptomyces sp. NPDC057062]|uniref:hypothetical protein n=1 Tax=Streptomyces sp. NPDC057062 TaxID=3346011 RepID=UPI0036D31C97
KPNIEIKKGHWSKKRLNESQDRNPKGNLVVKASECSPRLEFKRELGRQNEGMQPKIGISKGTWSSKRENAAQDWRMYKILCKWS